MRKRDRAELGRYVRACADLCELRDWTIRLDIDEPSADVDLHDAEEIQATMLCARGRKLGVLTVPPDTRKRWSREEFRHTIAHELVHCHLDSLWAHITSDAIGRMLGAGANSAFGAAAELHMEHAVDALASALAPNLPLIEWPS